MSILGVVGFGREGFSGVRRYIKIFDVFWNIKFIWFDFFFIGVFLVWLVNDIGRGFCLSTMVNRVRVYIFIFF